MSLSEITPPEIISSEKLSSKTASLTQKIWHQPSIIWIGLGVIALVLLLAFKSFFSSGIKKKNVVQNQPVVLSEENKLQAPQNIENKKVDNQLVLPSTEPLPHPSESKNLIDKSNTSSSSVAEELPVSPHGSNDTASSVSSQIMSDEKN